MRYSQIQQCLSRRARALSALALMSILALTHLGAEEAAPATESLESLVSQWSDLRLTMAQEERAFTEKEQQWQAEIALLTQESAALQKDIDSAEAHTSGQTPDSLALIQQREQLTQMAQRLPDLLEKAEADLSQWTLRLPSPHLTTLQHAFDRIPDDEGSRQALSPPERLQTVIALYSEIEKLQSSIFVGKEMLSLPNDTRREMDVCYLGLAQAFAVSGDNQHAAVGLPTASGWVWQPQDELTASIRQAINVYQRQSPPRWIRLPLQVSGGTP